MLFHLFEFSDERYTRTTFNHDIANGTLLLNNQSSLTISPATRPTDVVVRCDDIHYFLTIGYVCVL
jgi:hypothetical protein